MTASRRLWRFALLAAPRTPNLSRVVTSFSGWREPLPAGLAQEIDLLWQKEAGAGHRGLFDGRLAGLARWTYDGQILRLELVPVYYRELWYVHVLAGKEEVPPPSVLPRALGISAVLVQGQEVVLMLRSRAVGEWPQKLDVFGGHVDWPVGGSPNAPAEATREELREELGAAGEQAVVESCLGLVEVVRTRKPEIVFLARLPAGVPLSLEGTNEEVEGLVRLPVAELPTLLVERSEELTPSAEASLWLFASTLGKQR